MRIVHTFALVASVAAALSSAPALAGSSGDHNHGHATSHAKLREVPAGATPGIAIEASADASDGYNLHIAVKNFTFSPQHAGQGTDVLEGHAHLYVNDVKVARVYGAWFHLPAKFLQPGKNRVRISLNDNTHGLWTVGGHPLEAKIELAGSVGVDVSQDIDNISVHVKEGMHAQVVGVAQGAFVNLTVHGAGEKQLHLHGYDVAFNGMVNQPATASFEALHTGRFALEIHLEGDLLGRTELPILYLEVRAR